MGDRAQLKIGNIYLYTHWGGSNLKNVLKTALEKRLRWEDEEYLARIIFDEMTKNSTNQETGFGIGTVEHCDLDAPLIEVDVKNQKVIRNSVSKSFEKFIK